jgi:NhaP-type Na+/H+ or K+/H+ antiporter
MIIVYAIGGLVLGLVIGFAGGYVVGSVDYEELEDDDPDAWDGKP